MSAKKDEKAGERERERERDYCIAKHWKRIKRG